MSLDVNISIYILSCLKLFNYLCKEVTIISTIIPDVEVTYTDKSGALRKRFFEDSFMMIFPLLGI